MSDALVLTKLIWNGKHGSARHSGVTWEIHQWPAGALPGVKVIEIEFFPGHRDGYLRETGKNWRQITPAEHHQLLAYLRGVARTTHRRSQEHHVGLNSDFTRLQHDFGDDPPPGVKLLIEHRRESLEWRTSLEGQLAAQAGRMDRVIEQLQENTKLTQANAQTSQIIVDTLTAGRMLRRIMSWIGAIAVGVTAVWSLARMFFENGPPAGPHSP